MNPFILMMLSLLLSQINHNIHILLSNMKNPILAHLFPYLGKNNETNTDIQDETSNSKDENMQNNMTDNVVNEEIKEGFTPTEGVEEKEEKPMEEKDLSKQIDDVKKDIQSIQEIIGNIQCNVAMLVQNQATAADVAVMKRENEAFRSDSNIKLMRRYGIDAMIKTYQSISDRIFRIKHPKPNDKIEDAELTALNWVLNRMEKQFKSLGIKLNTSLPGTTIDESYMVVYGSDGEDVNDDETIIKTDDESLKDTVKESVCPAFIWTIPSLIGDVKEWCMEAEKVCIYK